MAKVRHCRADVWRGGFGWVPTDPADGRKVVLQEPRETLTLTAAAALFGAWKGDWIAYTFDHAPLSFSLRP